MPNSTGPNAAQVIITPDICPGVNILNSQLSAPLTTCKKQLLSDWGLPSNPPTPTPTFVTMDSDTNKLIFTGPGYVNFYLQPPTNPAPAAGSATLRVVGIAFANVPGGPQQRSGAQFNMPMSYCTLIEEGSPALPAGCTSGIQVYNMFKTPKGEVADWDFYIIYQSSDGTLSMIDPDWENQNDT